MIPPRRNEMSGTNPRRTETSKALLRKPKNFQGQPSPKVDQSKVPP